MTIEYELDPATMRRTGRWRRGQFLPTMRYLAIPPSKRATAPWQSEGDPR